MWHGWESFNIVQVLELQNTPCFLSACLRWKTSVLEVFFKKPFFFSLSVSHLLLIVLFPLFQPHNFFFCCCACNEITRAIQRASAFHSFPSSSKIALISKLLYLGKCVIITPIPASDIFIMPKWDVSLEPTIFFQFEALMTPWKTLLL